MFALALLALTPGDIPVARVNVSDDLTYEVALVLGIAAGLGLIGELVTSGLRRGWVLVGLLAVATLIGGTYGLTGSMLVETYISEASTTSEAFDGGAAFVTVGMLGLVVVIALTFVVATFIPKTDNDGSRMRRGVLRSPAILMVAGVYGAVVGPSLQF